MTDGGTPGSVTTAREHASLIVALTEVGSLSQAELEFVLDAAARLAKFAGWVCALDDPDDPVGREERRTVTLEKIIGRAEKAVTGG